MTASAREETRVVVRPRSLRIPYAVCTGVLTAFFGLIAAMAVSGPLSAVRLLIGLVLAVVMARRAARIELTLDENGVRIQNLLRSYTLTWAEIGEVWIGVESVGTAFMPAVSFSRRGERKPISSQVTTVKREQQRVLRAIRPYAEHWHIRVHD